MFAQVVTDRTTETLKKPIEHLAAEGGQVTTDGWASYQSVGTSVRPDVKHHVVNHKETFINKEGIKREVRRRFWQVTPKNSQGEHLQLVVFLENCRISRSPINPIVAWFSACRKKMSEKTEEKKAEDPMDTD